MQTLFIQSSQKLHQEMLSTLGASFTCSVLKIRNGRKAKFCHVLALVDLGLSGQFSKNFACELSFPSTVRENFQGKS